MLYNSMERDQEASLVHLFHLFFCCYTSLFLLSSPNGGLKYIHKGPRVKDKDICLQKFRNMRKEFVGQWTRVTMMEEVDTNL